MKKLTLNLNNMLKVQNSVGGSKYNSSSKTKAFTLAEVLITLAIIGVVSAMVIPSIISKVNRLQVESGLPVAYQNLKQIITAAEQDEGPMEEWSIRSREEAAKDDFEQTFVEEYFVPYVQGAKYEYTTARNYGYENGIKDATTGNEILSDRQYPIMTLPNGMTAIFKAGSGQWGIEKPGTTNEYDWVGIPVGGLAINVDINGLKKPNVLGKDIFAFEIYIETEDKLSMVGHLNTYAGVNPGSYTASDLMDAFDRGDYGWRIRDQENLVRTCMTLSAGACGAWIMRNSWKIPDHYPYL